MHKKQSVPQPPLPGQINFDIITEDIAQTRTVNRNCYCYFQDLSHTEYSCVPHHASCHLELLILTQSSSFWAALGCPGDQLVKVTADPLLQVNVPSVLTSFNPIHTPLSWHFPAWKVKRNWHVSKLACFAADPSSVNDWRSLSAYLCTI